MGLRKMRIREFREIFAGFGKYENMELRESLDYISDNSYGIEKKKQKLWFLVIALKRKVKVKLTVKL